MEKHQQFIQLAPPAFGDEELNAVVDVLKSGWITTGPKTKDFENALINYTHADAALGLNSCTAGLHLSLKTLGIGPGDQVIVPSLTFTATVNVIEHVGAHPYFVDVEPDTLNIDPTAIEQAITPKTKAIIGVHFAGHPMDLNALAKICEKHGVALIEDAAHAISASYQGGKIGSHGNLTSFSFYANKNITTAEGGMLVGPKELIEKAQPLSLHGLDADAWKRFGKEGRPQYDVVSPGFKYNMTDLQASLGLCQLKKLDGFQQKRRKIVEDYQRQLKNTKGLRLPIEREDVESAWHIFPIHIAEGTLQISRDDLVEKLKEWNIGTTIHYRPVHTYSYYKEKYGADWHLPHTMNFAKGTLSLPLHPHLTSSEVIYICDVLKSLLEDHRS